MKAWLAGLEPRERLLLYAVAGVLGIILLYLILIRPLHTRYHQLVTAVQEQRTTLQWMQQSAIKVRQLKSISPAAAAGLGGRSLLSVTDTSARAAKLGSALKRVEPEGDNGVRVWLDNAAFDSFIGWLDVMASRYGADVDTITLERSEAVGRVNARVTLKAYQP
jgi:general secretion pathway protein M